MDKSRPGHQAKRPERLPLIIDRPDLSHPVKRTLGFAFTTLAWAIWVGMWVPFIAALGRHFGYDLPDIVLPSKISLETFLALARVSPYVLVASLLLILGSLIFEKIKVRFAKPKDRWRPVGMERLATSTALDPELLKQWQSARILYVEHGQLGRVVNATPTSPGHELNSRDAGH